MFKVPEKQRLRVRGYESDERDGNNGLFVLRKPEFRFPLRCIASDGMGWEHVSVSTEFRCPTWEEMCFVKSKFWGPEDVVVQLHVPQSEWVNCHPYCLHLWRKVDSDGFCERPPYILVGPQTI